MTPHDISWCSREAWQFGTRGCQAISGVTKRNSFSNRFCGVCSLLQTFVSPQSIFFPIFSPIFSQSKLSSPRSICIEVLRVALDGSFQTVGGAWGKPGRSLEQFFPLWRVRHRSFPGGISWVSCAPQNYRILNNLVGFWVVWVYESLSVAKFGLEFSQEMSLSLINSQLEALNIGFLAQL